MRISLSQEAILSLENDAKTVLRFPENRKWDSEDKDARFKSCFGAPSKVIAAAWEMIKDFVRDDIERYHILWGLIFLKVYAPNEEVHCGLVGWPTKQQFREIAWHIVEILADQKDKIIKLKNRFKNAPPNAQGGLIETPKLTIDCTDCMIDEPWPWNKKWVSPKFKGAGLKYEVAIAIHSNNICWSNGPYGTYVRT